VVFFILQIATVRISCAQKIDAKVSTMFLFYFSKYIEWPKTKDNVKVAIYADDKDFNIMRNILVKKQANGKNLVITQLKEKQLAYNYDLIFIANNKNGDAKTITQACAQTDAVVVVEKLGASKKGAGIEIYLDEDDDNKTKFIVNKKLLEGKGFKLSNQLLSLSNQ
jgi:YfiR/HmsC-like